MAAAGKAVGEFLQGSQRQSLFLQRNCYKQQRCRLLWGSLQRQSLSLRMANGGHGLTSISRTMYPVKPKAAVVLGDVSSCFGEDSVQVDSDNEKVLHFFRIPLIQESANAELLKKVQTKVSREIGCLKTEQCFNIGINSELSDEKLEVLNWLLGETYEPDNLGTESFLENENQSGVSYVIEVGPRLSFTTAWSANAVSICKACGLTEITRLERSRRYTLILGSGIPGEVEYIDVMGRGRKALEEINDKMGLAFDEQDLQYYTRLFREDVGRNPTTVELFDIAQYNNCEDTLKANPNNSVIGFKDNSSAIRGFLVKQLRPSQPGLTSPLTPSPHDLDILFTAETHNFPCAVAPFPGAETGAGGRIRDTHATGRGSYVVASTAATVSVTFRLMVHVLHGRIQHSHTQQTWRLLCRFSLRQAMVHQITATNSIDHNHITKGEADIGMLVVKIGGPAYRIGMGGGAASSMVSGQNDANLDFNAVQRGDAEMAQKLYRVVRACIEMGEGNPIISIHDQGAGGNCNVVKEIIYPNGAEIDIRAIVVGDHTMSVLEIWGAEYQEQDAILVKPESRYLLQSICERERVSMAVLGTFSGEGRVTLVDSLATENCRSRGLPPPPPSVDLELEKVLGDMPQKCFEFTRVVPAAEPLKIPPGTAPMDSLERVLRLPSVCSKRFLTTKVDSCVTGLVAQQQTVGPLQLTLADVAFIAQSYTEHTGGACAIGEQPIKGLLDPTAMARLAVGEALTNLVWAKITSLSDVKASGNWMYAAKLDGEGAAMYDAANALSEAMIELGIAIDGGKDSLSMAAHASDEVVKAPGNLVISVYATCPDITLTVTPDLKLGDDGVLLLIDLGKGKRRLGGSAFVQVYNQVGDDCPDIDDVSYLKRVFETVQELLTDMLISSGHDISDGGLLVCILEMAFAGNCGLSMDLISRGKSLFETLFAEELGLVLEVSKEDLDTVKSRIQGAHISAEILGQVTSLPTIHLSVDGVPQLERETSHLRDMWEETSFQLEGFQRLASCVQLEKSGLKSRHEPSWALSFTPTFTKKELLALACKPKVAVIREEGSNGDREMSAALYASGFEPWDIAMSDLLRGSISLDGFRGIVFVGGFSYADVLDSAKGWSASIRFNQPLLTQFQEFYNRPDTFSLGVCNGCQLMALLGWIPGAEVGGVLGVGGDPSQPRFIHNESGRFECRFTSVTIGDSPSIMFKGMEGSTLGVWSAHGEGRAYFPDIGIQDYILNSNLAPLRYCDDSGGITEVYPFNPNGSPLGVAAICSKDGRHLAMMPHPERCFLMWQFPWYPKHWNVDKKDPSRWLRMFQNAREWCS
ncbi:hypothetical protein C5167_007592 [Papaver somniferum]|nr:hypothetical protein C5167_007592 [Papaver somniferum]